MMQMHRWIVLASVVSAPLFAALGCKKTEDPATTDPPIATPPPLPTPTMAASSPFAVEDIFGDAADPENPLTVLSHLDASALNATGLLQAFMSDGGPMQFAGADLDDAGPNPRAKR